MVGLAFFINPIISLNKCINNNIILLVLLKKKRIYTYISNQNQNFI